MASSYLCRCVLRLAEHGWVGGQASLLLVVTSAPTECDNPVMAETSLELAQQVLHSALVGSSDVHSPPPTVL